MPASCRRHWPDALDARSLEVSGVKSILRANGGAAFGQFALAFFIGMVSAAAAAAQKKAPEFTRQGLLITTFVPHGSADLGFGRKAADEVRGRVSKLSSKREVDVISGGDIGWQLTRAGMPEDTLLDEQTIRTLGRLMRADEYVVGVVDRAPGRVRLSGRLVLMRDRRMAEPIPSATAQDVGLAADQFGRALAAARNELVPQRRCE